ncbi:hypothetical protein FQZ97_715860 [compost metagenome]
MSDFKLTYSTMYAPPEALHEFFERALAELKADLGRDHALLIDGRDQYGAARWKSAAQSTRTCCWDASMSPVGSRSMPRSPPRATPSPPGAPSRGNSASN